MHCPTRAATALPRASRLKAKAIRLTPGRASGVSAGNSVRSMAASTSQAMTLVALPQKTVAAVWAHGSVSAVTISRVARDRKRFGKRVGNGERR